MTEEDGGNPLKLGTGELDRTLLEPAVVDEFHLWHLPALAGAGQSPIDGIDTTHLELFRHAEGSSRALCGGVRP